MERGHAAGAQHIPMGDVPDRIAEISTATLYVVCHAGGRSAGWRSTASQRV